MIITLAFVLIVVGFILGVFVGFAIERYMSDRMEPIGDLRIDESDPEDGPYLFLELKTAPNNFKSLKQVTLNVKAENYISQR